MPPLQGGKPMIDCDPGVRPDESGLTPGYCLLALRADYAPPATARGFGLTSYLFPLPSNFPALVLPAARPARLESSRSRRGVARCVSRWSKAIAFPDRRDR